VWWGKTQGAWVKERATIKDTAKEWEKKNGSDENKHTQSFAVNIRKIRLRRRTGNGSKEVEVGGTQNIRSVRGWRGHKDINKIGSQQQQSYEKKNRLQHNVFLCIPGSRGIIVRCVGR
jgi:hypothetical protein